MTYVYSLVSVVSSRPAKSLLLGAILVPLLLVGATLAHTHDAPGIGLYNAEHDLLLMGALGWAAALPTFVIGVVVVLTTWLVAAPALAIGSSSRRRAVSRAPPTA